MRHGLFAILVVAACSGSTPHGPDAAHFCAGSAYDPCGDEHNCPLVPSADCMPVGVGSASVCTLSCMPGGAACPDDGTGSPAACVVPNGGTVGFCAPASATPSCTANPNLGSD